jgi:hypothetical protein
VVLTIRLGDAEDASLPRGADVEWDEPWLEREAERRDGRSDRIEVLGPDQDVDFSRVSRG